jgi:hypothetical protein
MQRADEPMQGGRKKRCRERWDKSKDLQAFMMVCSLMIMSVVSVRGRDTRDAMAAPSVSRMILSYRGNHGCMWETEDVEHSRQSSRRKQNIDQSADQSTSRIQGKDLNLPIIDSLISGQENHIQPF